MVCPSLGVPPRFVPRRVPFLEEREEKLVRLRRSLSQIGYALVQFGPDIIPRVPGAIDACDELPDADAAQRRRWNPEILEQPQLWEADDWAGRFGLTPEPGNTGYGHALTDVVGVRPESADALVEYLAAVDQRTRDFLGKLAASELDRIVDRNWDPPVTLGVRLVSIADDCLQHAGQANYVRGLLGY